jgi:hypothetical protein
MAKQPPSTPESETPFQRFERLARKLIAVPKAQVLAQERKRKRRGDNMYPEKKTRDLTDAEKALLRERIERGGEDYVKLARDIGCSTSQVAGIKAAMHRP